MAPKKAAKHVAKKAAAKKHAAKHAGRHDGLKDIRRAYEHLGRLEALESSLPPVAIAQVQRLSALAQTAMQGGDSRSAADLLRAAEHLSFAALAPAGRERIDRNDLLDAVTNEYLHLRGKAEDHWKAGKAPGVEALYEKAMEAAEIALSKGSYRRALEFIRAAEALAHVKLSGVAALPAGAKQPKLRG